MKYYLIIIILFCSCNTQTSIIGKYASRNQPDCFEFKADSTFLYEYHSFAYEYSKGEWRGLNKHTIILNSNINSTAIPIKVDEHDLFNSEESMLSFSLKIVGDLKLSDYKCNIFINDTFYVVKRCDSLSSIKIKKPIHDIYLLFAKRPLVFTSTLVSMPLYTEIYKTKNKWCNLKIETFFTDSLFSYRPFNNEKIKIKKKKIRTYNSFTKRWKGLSKVSDSTNIFYSFFNKE